MSLNWRPILCVLFGSCLLLLGSKVWSENYSFDLQALIGNTSDESLAVRYQELQERVAELNAILGAEKQRTEDLKR